MPLYVGDYLAKTRSLTTLQHGAYMLLIMEYWVKGGLPTDDKKLQRICGLTSRQWQSNSQAIASFFNSDWKHDRIELELEKARNISMKRSVFGAIGGRKSRGKDNVARFVDHHLRSKS
jgi:uncharacterized protein YdaU (DUF1376 family)